MVLYDECVNRTVGLGHTCGLSMWAYTSHFLWITHIEHKLWEVWWDVLIKDLMYSPGSHDACTIL